jgi:integrase
MATINNKNGKLQLDFRYKGKRCREQTKLEDNQANRRRTKKILDRIEAEITLGTFVYADYFPNSKKAIEFDELNDRILADKAIGNNTPTFADFSDIWLNEKQIEWRDSHMASVITNLKAYTLPEFCEKDVSSITKAQILNFRSTLAKEPKRKKSPLSPATINKIMTPLRMIINEAADRYDFTSPFLGIKSLKIPRIDVEPFSIEEVQLILKSVRKDFLPYYTARFFTGMRTGEIDGLQWRYVDFKKRLILVRETVVDGKVTYTKNDGSQRDIQMSQPVFDALKQQEEATGGHKFVFQNTAGSPLAHNNVTKRVWYPLLRYLNLKARRPYQSRHTAATLWLAAGENPEWIARQMGHTTTEMLFRIYSRYVPNLTRQDGSAFERLLTTNFSARGEHHE